MSFTCDHCGYQNNEIQSSGVVPERGVKITLTVKDKSDLNRQLVKSDHTSIKIPEVSFEIPSQSQKGGWSLFLLSWNRFRVKMGFRGDHCRGYN